MTRSVAKTQNQITSAGRCLCGGKVGACADLVVSLDMGTPTDPIVMR